jgi:hypothetical protein
MLPLIRKKNKDGLFYYTTRKSVILKNLKNYTSFPVNDERELLIKERFIEAILMTSLRIEQNLKEIYFRTYCKQVMGVYYEILELSFNKIVNLCRASGIITKEDFENIDLLRKARNEIAHNPHINNRTVDKEKCNLIINPCLNIIQKTHDELVEISKKKIKK